MSITTHEEGMPIMAIFKLIAQLAAAGLGLAIVVIGLNYAMDVFQLILSALKSPSILSGPIQELADSFGGRAFDLKLSDHTVPLANLVALAVYCCGVLAAAFLTMALMQTGAKVVSLAVGDRAAVKQLLQSAFGSRVRSGDRT